MYKAIARIFLIAFLSISTAWADQITLKNGDRLSGTILKSDNTSLVMKSEFAGTVTVQWAAIDTIASSRPVTITLKDGQTVVGTATTQDGKIQLQTASAGPVTITKDAIQFIRSPEEQTAYERQIDRFRNPRLSDLWTGFLDLGFAQTSGNASTTTFNLGLNAARTTPRDKITVSFASLYASNSTTGRKLTTARAARGGIRYDVNLTSRLFAFGLLDLEYDRFQRLNLRSILGGGLGYHAIKTDRTMFDLFGGATWNQEFFSFGPNRRSAELVLGESLSYKFSDRVLLTEKLSFFPNLSDTGEFRLAFDTATVTKLNKWLNWQLSFSDRYLSNPIPGVKKNDTLLTTGLRVTFGE